MVYFLSLLFLFVGVVGVRVGDGDGVDGVVFGGDGNMLKEFVRTSVDENAYSNTVMEASWRRLRR